MYSAYILISLKDNQQFTYANPNKIVKLGTDGPEFNYTKISNVPNICYYYTGYGNDTKADQTVMLADLSTWKGYIGTTGTVDIVKHNNDFPISFDKAVVTKTINKADIVSVELIEKWISSPANDREGAERLPRDNSEFQGTNEYANLREEHKADLVTTKTIEKDANGKYILQKRIDEKTGIETKIPKEFENILNEKEKEMRYRVKEGLIK